MVLLWSTLKLLLSKNRKHYEKTKTINSVYSLLLVIFKWAFGIPAWANSLSSSDNRRLRGGSSIAMAARDASSILRVASSIAREAASIASASRSVRRSVRLLWWEEVGGRLSSSPTVIKIYNYFIFYNMIDRLLQFDLIVLFARITLRFHNEGENLLMLKTITFNYIYYIKFYILYI